MPRSSWNSVNWSGTAAAMGDPGQKELGYFGKCFTHVRLLYVFLFKKVVVYSIIASDPVKRPRPMKFRVEKGFPAR